MFWYLFIFQDDPFYSMSLLANVVFFVAPRNKIDHMLIVTSDITRCTLVLANAGRGFVKMKMSGP